LKKALAWHTVIHVAAPTRIRIFHFDEDSFAKRLGEALARLGFDAPIVREEIEAIKSANEAPKLEEDDLGIVVVSSRTTAEHFGLHMAGLSSRVPFLDKVVTVAEKGLDESYFSTFSSSRPPFFVDPNDPGSSADLASIALFLSDRTLGEDVPDVQPPPPPQSSEASATPEFVNAARKVLQIGQAPLGAVFEAGSEYLFVISSAEETDLDAAKRLIVQQLHQDLLYKSARFLDVAPRLDNQVGWAGIGRLAQRIFTYVNRSTIEVPDVLGHLYSSTLELGSFLEMDRRVSAGEFEYVLPLQVEMRRPLEDLVSSLAPWMRAFPTIRQLDDEAAKFLVKDNVLVEPSIETVDAAGRNHAVLADDLAALRGLLEASNRGPLQGTKAGHRGTVSARNMVVAAVGAISAFYLNAVASDFATKSLGVQRIGTFLAEAEKSILMIMAGLPDDLRLAVEVTIIQARDYPAVPPAGTKLPGPPIRRPREP
jgi:hypothetical protein